MIGFRCLVSMRRRAFTANNAQRTISNLQLAPEYNGAPCFRTSTSNNSYRARSEISSDQTIRAECESQDVTRSDLSKRVSKDIRTFE